MPRTTAQVDDPERGVPETPARGSRFRHPVPVPPMRTESFPQAAGRARPASTRRWETPDRRGAGAATARTAPGEPEKRPRETRETPQSRAVIGWFLKTRRLCRPPDSGRPRRAERQTPRPYNCVPPASRPPSATRQGRRPETSVVRQGPHREVPSSCALMRSSPRRDSSRYDSSCQHWTVG